MEKTERVQVNYLLPEDLADRIRREAKATKRWPAWVVTEACEQYLSRPKADRQSQLASA